MQQQWEVLKHSMQFRNIQAWRRVSNPLGLELKPKLILAWVTQVAKAQPIVLQVPPQDLMDSRQIGTCRWGNNNQLVTYQILRLKIWKIPHQYKFTAKTNIQNSKTSSEVQAKLTLHKLRMEQLVQPGQLTHYIKHLNQQIIRAVSKALICNWIRLLTMLSIRNHQGIPLDWQHKLILQDQWQEMLQTIIKAMDSDSTLRIGLQLRSLANTEMALTPWPPSPWNEVDIWNLDRTSLKNQQSTRANITSRFPKRRPQA